MSAGTDAPSQVLTITMFHILRNPDVARRLKEEFTAAITQNPWEDVPWGSLEQLKYLVSYQFLL